MDTTNQGTTETQATAPATNQGATSVPSQGATQSPATANATSQSPSTAPQEGSQSEAPTSKGATELKQSPATTQGATARQEATREQSRPTPPPLPSELQQGKDPKALQKTIEALQQRLERLIAGDETDLWALLPEALFLTQCRLYGVDTMWRLSVCKNVQVSLSLYI